MDPDPNKRLFGSVKPCVYEGFWGHEGEFLPWRKFALSFALSHFPLDHSLSAQTRDSGKKGASAHICI